MRDLFYTIIISGDKLHTLEASYVLQSTWNIDSMLQSTLYLITDIFGFYNSEGRPIVWYNQHGGSNICNNQREKLIIFYNLHEESIIYNAHHLRLTTCQIYTADQWYPITVMGYSS